MVRQIAGVYKTEVLSIRVHMTCAALPSLSVALSVCLSVSLSLSLSVSLSQGRPRLS